MKNSSSIIRKSKRVIFLISILSLCSFNIYAQGSSNNFIEIKGIVMDSLTKSPIPYATVSILKENKELVVGKITDEKGLFSFKSIPIENYALEVRFIGFKTKIIKVTGKDIIDVGTIYLNEYTSELDEVTITAKRTTIEQHIDRKVINVGKDLITVGPTAAQILNNLPSVFVDQSGNVTFRDSNNVTILVDGKTTNIPNSQLLKQIPSASISKIELITNPSAKYNPEGMSGIINIILKKNTSLGFNGNLSLGLDNSEHSRFNGALDLNYRKGKFNFFGSYSNFLGKFFNSGDINRLDDNSLQSLYFLDNYDNHLFKIGFDFSLNDKNTFSFYTNQSINQIDSDNHFRVIYPSQPSSNITQNLLNDNSNKSKTYNFDYKHTFKESHSLELEIDINSYEETQNANFITTDSNNSVSSYIDDVDYDRNSVTVNLDYEVKFDNGADFESGLESRVQKSNNGYFNTSQQNQQNLEFDYDREIYSAYSTYGKDYEKWSYKLGIRAEKYNVNAKTNSVETYSDDYFTLYPSVFLRYAPNDKNSYQISYGRRVDRPGLDLVNPIRDYNTPRTITIGNPFLKPQFSNSIESNYTRNFEKGYISIGAFYRYIKDEIDRLIYNDPNDSSVAIITYANYDDISNSGLELYNSYKISKWWSFNGSFDLYNLNQKSSIDNNLLEVNSLAYNIHFNNTYKIGEKLNFQWFGYYRSEREYVQFTTKDVFFMNIGASYSLFKDKGSLSITYNDFLNTYDSGITSSNPFPQIARYNWESQTLYINFSYSFGSNKEKALERKNRDDNTRRSEGGIF